MDEQPKIIVNVLVKRTSKTNIEIITMKRKRQNAWAIPGGHLDKDEQLLDCAIRECLEETGVKIKNPKLLGFSQDINKEKDAYYLMFWVEAEFESGELENKEPNRCLEVKWTHINKFPEPVFEPLKKFLNKEYTMTK
jgi:8-oxo-dGTP diphosphatase